MITHCNCSSRHQSQPAFGSSDFGPSPYVFPSAPSIESSNEPKFGAATTAFGAQSLFGDHQSKTPTCQRSGNGQSLFGASSSSAFRSASIPANGFSTSQVFGSSSSPFGGPFPLSQPAFASSGFGNFASTFQQTHPPVAYCPMSSNVTSQPAFSHVSVNPCSFSTPSNPFAPKNSTFSTPFHPSILSSVHGIRQPPFGCNNEVSGFIPCAQTPLAHNGSFTQSAENLKSISAMPACKEKSHEELRWEDYQSEDKGGGISQIHANPFASSIPTHHLRFGSSHGFGQAVFGGGSSSVCQSCGGTGINTNNKQSSSPFGQTSSPFVQTVTAFGQTYSLSAGQTSHPVPIQPTQNPASSLYAAWTGGIGGTSSIPSPNSLNLRRIREPGRRKRRV